MTDAEINLAIAKIECPDYDFKQGRKAALCKYASGEIAFQRDYCNNWEDIGPIIEREKIDLIWYKFNSMWAANAKNSEFVKYAETPMKATALCFLKMKGK